MFTERVQSRSAQRDATTSRVLASAERLFRAQGFDATTIRGIAAEAQVSPGTVMGVGDKDALLVAVFDTWIADVHRRRLAEGGPLASGNVVDAVAELFGPFVAYFEQDRALSRRYASVIVKGAHASPIFRDLATALVAEIADTLTRAGLGDDAVRAARVIYFAYLGVIMTGGNQSSDGLSVPAQLREVISCVTEHQKQEK